jgi:hypothetical protein
LRRAQDGSVLIVADGERSGGDGGPGCDGEIHGRERRIIREGEIAGFLDVGRCDCVTRLRRVGRCGVEIREILVARLGSWWRDQPRFGGCVPAFEVFEELLLGEVNCGCVAGGNLGGCVGLFDGTAGFGGKELAIAGGLGVAFGDGGGDAVGAAVGRGLCRGDGCGRAGASFAGAVGGEAFRDLLLEQAVGIALGLKLRIEERRLRIDELKLRGPHCVQILTHFR